MNTSSRKLNVGCGRNILQGWLNLDHKALNGVDIVSDIDNCEHAPIPLPDNCIDEFLLSHVIEHLHHPLPLMQELHRIASDNAIALIRTPYGSSDDAFEDPTHVRQYFHGSFGYFSQPFYWRADYGYRGDWQVEMIQLVVRAAENQGLTPEQIMARIKTQRNQVIEMIAQLKVVKPIREPLAELQQGPKIEIVMSE
ncbi:class I SAM-dependent methyltransferase [Aliikangiella maris]|uniref:Methyltransferase domain-containing protein n=2 Tax=Aliikangiella maris TaxID=3162458 RepID=A0ABV2BU30_9GAMM